MTLLDRHIRNTVLVSILVLVSIMSVMDLVFSLVEEFADVTANYSVADAFAFVLLNTPTRIYELLPFSVLGGALVGLGLLASNNEILVVQSAGVRVWRIVWAVLKPTIVIMSLNLLVGEFVAPPLDQLGQSNKIIQRSGTAAISSEQGTWQKIGSEYVHINAIAPGGELLFGVTRYRIGDQRRIVASSFAESANYVGQGSSGFWQLNNVRESSFDQGRIMMNEYLLIEWPVDMSPNLLNVLIMVPDRQSLSGLYQFSRYFESEGLDSTEYLLAFWKKLLQPIATVALVILAISFVFGPLRESTLGARVFIAIAIGLGYTILQRLLEPISVLYGLSPLMAVLAPIFLALMLGTMLLNRVR